MRGQPVVEAGQVRKRGRGDKPQCAICPRSEGWTDDNRRTYTRWRFWLRGLLPAPESDREAWDFFALDEAARGLEGELMTASVNRAIVGAFGNG